MAVLERKKILHACLARRTCLINTIYAITVKLFILFSDPLNLINIELQIAFRDDLRIRHTF
jgi:hypothetical protein